jgi:hypothetical protein
MGEEEQKEGGKPGEEPTEEEKKMLGDLENLTKNLFAGMPQGQPGAPGAA